MRRFARSWLVALLVVLALVAAACGNDEKETKTSGGTTATTAKSGGAGEGKKVGLVFDIGGRGDKSFNDAAYAGLTKAQKDFGVDVKYLEPTAGGENREELVRLLAQQGYELIFGVGFLFKDSIQKVAGENPKTMFGQIDEVIDLPNVASLTFAEEQGSYLVGAAAALKSKTGKIGFIGGVDQPLIHKFEAGYVAGAKKIKPDINIQVKYLTQPPDFNGFKDQAKGYETALGMYGNGADVVYAAAGLSGVGMFKAAKEVSAKGTKVWGIGVDSDQYESLGDPSLQPFVLSSMVKRVDVAVYDTIKDFVNGSFKGTHTVFDLKADGVGYATSGGFVDDIKAQLEDLKQQIIDGKITVPSA